MKDSVRRVEILPAYGMHVAHNRTIFLNTWASIAESMLRYNNILPEDWLDIVVTVNRDISPKKTPRREYKKELELVKKTIATHRRKP